MPDNEKRLSIEGIIYQYHRAIDELVDNYQGPLAKIPAWTNQKRLLVAAGSLGSAVLTH